MAQSYNGWPVLSSDSRQLRKWIIPGTNRHFVLRDGSAGFLLALFLLWYHEAVERLDLRAEEWDDWGYAYRPVRGETSGFSNHASGTAADANATKHPMGVSPWKTLTPKQIRMIRRRLKHFMRGTLAWGGEWSRPDGMHYELAVPLRRAEKVARILSNTKRGRRILKANPGARRVIFS
jgi:hypothetical protein